MADDKIRLIRARNAQRGSFKRQGLSRKLRLEDTWRRPRGIQSKQRKDYRAKGRHPQSGFGSPKAVRYFHPSGFEEVMVCNVADLEGINAETQAVRISAKVGGNKRAAIQAKAESLKIKVLNVRVPKAKVEKTEKTEKAAEKKEEVTDDE